MHKDCEGHTATHLLEGSLTMSSQAGGVDNGKPQMHPEMSAQPCYSGFVLDPDGNNIEAVSFCGKWNGQP